MSEDDPIKNELNEILTKLRSGDSDLERLKLRLYATRQAIQIRAIECAEKRLTHEGEVLSHLRKGVRPSSETPVLPEASRPVNGLKGLREVWNGIQSAKGKRERGKTKILHEWLPNGRLKGS